SYIEGRGEDFVNIDGIEFKSRVLSVNLKNVNRVIPYIVTCGLELDELSNSISDVLLQYYLDEIKKMVVGEASSYLFELVKKRFRLTKIARMNPGSLEDWPISQQVPLFSIFGDTQASIGVTLTDSYLMIPTKSVSGIIFPTEVTYENCQ